ncbi:MAG TPA: helix-turn-helix domain-containing protein [Crenalkalicoccus sp.]|nr:helix-turn-helix domain-containing protein [Crenalkalicoccus sp.]
MEAAKIALASDPAALPRLAWLAEAAGVSPRSLQRHFAQVLGLGPHAVIQRIRLTAARQTLQSGEASSVLDAALRHGFEHPGRFAIAYARAFGEAPSATLRAARAQAPAAIAPSGTPILLPALAPATPGDAARARRATDDLAIALGRVRDLVLLRQDAPASMPDARRALRLEGRVEADSVVLSLVEAVRGVVVLTLRERLAPPCTGRGWADRAVGALRARVAEEQLERARRTPHHRMDVETLVLRARPAALSQEPALLSIALDMLEEALLRDPTHARAQALAGWCRAIRANHALTRDPDAERDRAIVHSRRALALAPDDPEVLTPVAGALSLAQHLDEAECLVTRSLTLDPDQPEALRRLGFIHNFRGDGRRAAAAFRRALSDYPGGSNGAIALIGLGVASFILGDYARSARALAIALDRQPSRAWPHRFLTAAAMNLGALEEARRSLVSLRRSFPDLTVDLCSRSDVLHAEAKERMLTGLARAGLPR